MGSIYVQRLVWKCLSVDKSFNVSLKTKKTFFHHLLLHQRNVLGTYYTDFPFLPCSFMFLHNSNKTLTPATHLSLQVSSFGHVSPLLLAWALGAVCHTLPQVPEDTGVLGAVRLRCRHRVGGALHWSGWHLAVSGSLIPSEEWNLRQECVPLLIHTVFVCVLFCS